MILLKLKNSLTLFKDFTCIINSFFDLHRCKKSYILYNFWWIFQKFLLLKKFLKITKKTKEAVIHWHSTNQMFLKMSQRSQESNYVSLFFNKVVVARLANYWKGTPAQVFSCEFCNIFKKTFFFRATPMPTSEKRNQL